MVVYSTEVQDAPATADAMSERRHVNLMAGPRSSLNLDMVKMVRRTSKGVEKMVMELVEKLNSWELKDEWESLYVAMLARLEQVLDISTSVVVGKNKYDLEKVMRNEKNEVRRMKLVVKSFMKSSITGNIKLADVQDDD